MKCPACEYICSELRDICPRCHIDLRPEKKKQGLSITSPNQSYEELLAKASGKKGVAAASGPASGVLSLVKNILGAKPTAPPAETVKAVTPPAGKSTTEAATIQVKSEAPAPKENSSTTEHTAIVEAEDVSFSKISKVGKPDDKISQFKPGEPSRESSPASAIEISKTPAGADFKSAGSEEELLKMLDTILVKDEGGKAPSRDEPKRTQTGIDEAPPPIQSGKKSEPAATSASIVALEGAETAPASSGSTPLPPAIPTPVISPADPMVARQVEKEQEAGVGVKPLVNSHLPPPSLPPMVTPSPAAPPNKTSGTETPAAKVDSKPVTPIAAVMNDLPHADQPDSTEMLFTLAHSEISKNNGALDLELTIENMQKDLPFEEITLLFDIAMDAVENPEAEALLGKELTFSKGQEATTAELSEVLSKVEKAIEIPQLSLKGNEEQQLKRSLRKLIDTEMPDDPRTQRKLVAASADRLFVSFFVDAIASFIFAAITTALTIMALDPELHARLMTSYGADSFDFIPAAAILACCTLISLTIYPFFSFCYFHKTFGTHFARTQVVLESGGRARLENLLVRSLCFPLTMLCGGFILPMLGYRSLHDYLARTMVIAR